MNARVFLLPLLAALSALALAAPTLALAHDGAELLAGAASGDITPPIGSPQFAYTDRSRVFNPANNTDLIEVLADPDPHFYARTFVPSKGIYTRLRARSVVIERDGVPFALAQVDLGGIPFAMSKAVAERVAPLGITQDHLIISATHTHSGSGAIWPDEDNSGYGFVGGDTFDKRIFDLTVDGISESIIKAYARREPARLGIGSTQVTNASRNRAGEAFALDQNKPATDIDPTLTVVRVDGTDHKPIAVWSNFAIHPTTIGEPILSGDNAGAAARWVEQEIGGGIVDVWTNGNEGDISPDTGPERIADQPLQYANGSLAGASQAGLKVAKGIVTAWKDAGRHMSGDVDVQSSQGYLPFDGTQADGEPVGPIPVLGMSVIAGEQACSPVDGAAGPGQGRKMFGFGGPGIVPSVAPVSIFKIGGLGIVTTPNEITWTMGKRIREAVAAASGGTLDHVITAGLTDGYLSYTATPEEYDHCGYEGGFTLFGRRQGPRIRDFASALAAHLLTGAPAPASAPEPAQTGLGTTADTPVQDTPQAGTAVDQPAASLERYGKAVFRWKGGDRAVDVPRGRTLVRLQHRDGGKWKTVNTDDGLSDTVTREKADTYVETYRFGACEPLGTYRFHVTGRASKDGAVGDYTLDSREFILGAVKLSVDGLTVAGGAASFRGLYPNPGPDSIITLPRVVQGGDATLLVDGEHVKAKYDPDTVSFRAPVPAGATVSVLELSDDCGNST